MSKLSKRIQAVLEEVKSDLDSEDIENAKELLEHDEWGEALSLIATQIYEYDIVLSDYLIEEMRNIALQMKMDIKELNLIETE